VPRCVFIVTPCFMSLQEAKQFVAQFVSGAYSPEKYATFLQWLRGATTEELNEIADEHESLHEQWMLTEEEPNPEWVAMLEEKLDRVPEKVQTPVRTIGNPLIRRRAWVAAASVIVLLSAGAVLYTSQKHEEIKDKGITAPVFSQSEVNPKGGAQKQIVLADGSKVLLNAATTLRYPADFNGPERVVELSGEAYFEVAKSAGKPFRVLIKDAEVEVLGTHFNIMAYENEPISKTTLVDGAVQLESGAKQFKLNPGEQAVVRSGLSVDPSASKYQAFSIDAR